jgi:fibronectin-binding autotransporter adhesin
MKTQHDSNEISNGQSSVHRSLFTVHSSQFNNNFSKRSKIMSASTFLRTGLMTLAAIFLLASIVLGGDFKNGGVLRNKSGKTFTVANGNFQNFNTANGVVLNAGIIDITGASKNFVNGNATLFGYVSNDTAASAGTITVTGSYVNDIGGTVNGTGKIQVGVDVTSSNSNFVTSSGEVDYNGSGAQNVLSTTYGTLALNGSAGTKSLAGDVTVSTAFTLSPSNIVAVATHTLNLNGSVTTGGSLSSATSGTVSYGGGNQNVIVGSYGNLTVAGTGTKTAGAGTVTINGLYSNLATTTLKVTDLTLASTATFTNNLGVTQVSGAMTNSLASPLATNLGGTFDFDASTGAQAIASGQYTNLTISATTTSGVTLASTYYISGNYTPSGSATRTYTGSTIRFNGASTQTIANDANAYDNLAFFGVGEKDINGAVTAGGAVTIDASVTGSGNNGVYVGTSGVLTINSTGSLTNDGVLTNDGTITVN